METQGELISLTILRQREALYRIRSQSDISRTDLEVLAFAVEKTFFTYYDIEKFFEHTNCQQLRRSLTKLVAQKFVRVLSKGVKNNATNYSVLPSAKKILKEYSTIILNENPKYQLG